MGLRKKKVKKEEVNEEEIIDMPGEEQIPDITEDEPEEEPEEEIEEDTEPPEIEENPILVKEKEIQELRKQVAREEEKLEKAKDVKEELEPQEPQVIPRQRMVYITDGEAIRQALVELQALRFEVQDLRYIIESEIAKE